jgi:hypothetical protein
MDYHKIVLFHRIVVSLFLLHYVVKLALLLLKKSDLLATYTAKTKVVEMIVSALFLTNRSVSDSGRTCISYLAMD